MSGDISRPRRQLRARSIPAGGCYPATPAVLMPISRKRDHVAPKAGSLSNARPLSHFKGPRPQAALLLLFPERQQPLRGRASDHAGDTDRHLPQRRGRNAAQRHGADADLAPEVEVAPLVRALALEVVNGGQRIAAQRADLHGVGGLNHLRRAAP